MELVKIINDGYIQIPFEIRQELDLQDGTNVVFLKEGDRIVIESAGKRAVRALEKVQKAFEGVAEELGLETDQDVVDLIKQVRREKREEKARLNNADNV